MSALNLFMSGFTGSSLSSSSQHMVASTSGSPVNTAGKERTDDDAGGERREERGERREEGRIEDRG